MRLQKEFNLTYLFITHDLSLMRNIASRVAIMYLGKSAKSRPAPSSSSIPNTPIRRCCSRPFR
ncbi:MAG: hypothetical protein R2911_11235 [Caldilineaceae bacterium]